MKTIRSLAVMLISLFVLSSCERDGDNILLSGFESSELIASTHQVTLTNDIRNQIVLSLAWNNCKPAVNNSSMGVADGLATTTLQTSTDENFSTCIESTESTLSKAYTGAELNALAKNTGMQPNIEGNLYFRLKASIGDNMEPKFSRTLTVKVTPYTLSMKELHVLKEDKSSTIATLYSPEENGIYTGFMNTTKWMKCWFSENDGTIWGNYGANGHTFELSDSGDAWNCWFPETEGCHYVTVDTKSKEWSATYLPSLTISGAASAEMNYSSALNSWKATIVTTADNASIQISGNGKQYNAKTGDKASTDFPVYFAASGQTISLSKTAGNITLAKAGTYTFTIDFSNPAEWTYSLKEGTEEKPKYPAQLDMKTIGEHPVLLTQLLKYGTKGIYYGFYNATQWDNFLLTDNENSIQYGSDPGNLYKLSKENGKYNLWFEQSGYFFMEANLEAMTWKPTEITQINVCGDFNGWSTTADLMTYDTVNKVWTATCDIKTVGWGLYFMINKDWNFTLNKNEGEGMLKLYYGSQASGNIIPSETGTYQITIDLVNYTYTLKKQS